MVSVNNWVADKLEKNERDLKVIDKTPEGFLLIEGKSGDTFLLAVLSVQGDIRITNVEHLFTSVNKPQLVINVPSKTLWSGEAIELIHSEQAAFGTYGDIARADATNSVCTYRDKNMGFFIKAMEQHGSVRTVSYVYETVFRVDRTSGDSLIVAVIDAYNMSAEDVRNARTSVGHFDVVVKSTSYGSITEQAEAAAESIGAKALTLKGLMQCLAR